MQYLLEEGDISVYWKKHNRHKHSDLFNRRGLDTSAILLRTYHLRRLTNLNRIRVITEPCPQYKNMRAL